MASSLVSGLLVQYHHTCVTCVILGFLGSWSLIFSVVPVIVILQIVSQRLAGPLLGVERAQFGLVAILVERAVSAIATVKAFNAVSHEHSAFAAVIRKLHNIGWGSIAFGHAPLASTNLSHMGCPYWASGSAQIWCAKAAPSQAMRWVFSGHLLLLR
jgi:hypothetical protein